MSKISADKLLKNLTISKLIAKKRKIYYRNCFSRDFILKGELQQIGTHAEHKHSFLFVLDQSQKPGITTS